MAFHDKNSHLGETLDGTLRHSRQGYSISMLQHDEEHVTFFGSLKALSLPRGQLAARFQASLR
jgi:hypothetical protein